jgi:hypothetical protein
MKTTTLLTTIAVLTASVPAFAAGNGQPANPGQFGQDRATYATTHDPGSVGAAASERAGTNGSINQTYMQSVGSLPAGVTPGQTK